MPITLPQKTGYLVGIISDTHGHLSNSALNHLKGVDLIIHAGDIDTPDILAVLAQIAPLVPVRGNMDYGSWAAALPKTEAIEVGQMWLYILHDLSRLDFTPEAAGFGIVISGHTHQTHFSQTDNTLYLNPGSASFPRRSSQPSMALLEIEKGKPSVRFIDLNGDRPAATAV